MSWPCCSLRSAFVLEHLILSLFKNFFGWLCFSSVLWLLYGTNFSLCLVIPIKLEICNIFHCLAGGTFLDFCFSVSHCSQTQRVSPIFVSFPLSLDLFQAIFHPRPLHVLFLSRYPWPSCCQISRAALDLNPTWSSVASDSLSFSLLRDLASRKPIRFYSFLIVFFPDSIAKSSYFPPLLRFPGTRTSPFFFSFPESS